MKKYEYQLIFASKLSEFESCMNYKINVGWKLQGGGSICKKKEREVDGGDVIEVYCQAVYKRNGYLKRLFNLLKPLFLMEKV